ncbi:hypothetical protein OH76DRAFT_1485822 [Lentinus brumalis]|uniref:DUF6533 domain-containing protein n=1 Tax=Lentinus brumalis TaxID=2498619 RepID=A0A371D0P8_9APHY|nr:hypothetical protein OH76DRAFT_1485822 [Polyporus brumalis]
MSSDLDDSDVITPADILQLYTEAWVPQVNYLAVGSVALIVYEHLLTIVQEYRVIWRRKLSIPMVLFIVNRYGLLAFGVIYALSTLLWWEDDLPSSQSCEIIGRVQIVLVVVLDVVNVAFSALRIHAINNRNWWWTASIFLLGFVSTPLNIADLITASYMTGNPLIEGCFASIVSLGIRACKIWLDVMVLGITWYRTAGIVKAARNAHVDTSLVSVLIRDGTTYFFITLSVNIAGIITLVAGLNSLGVEASVQVLNAVTMSRFILNLRVANSHAGGTSRTLSSLSPQLTEIQFSSKSSVLGNIGASVEFTGDSDCDVDGEDVACGSMI